MIITHTGESSEFGRLSLDENGEYFFESWGILFRKLGNTFSNGITNISFNPKEALLYRIIIQLCD